MGQVVRGEFKGFEEDTLLMNELFNAFIRDCTRQKLRGVDIIGYHVKHLREWFGAMNADQVTERDISSTVSPGNLERSFMDVQWSQSLTLFPMREAGKLIALQALLAFGPHLRHRAALKRLAQDHRHALANLR